MFGELRGDNVKLKGRADVSPRTVGVCVTAERLPSAVPRGAGATGSSSLEPPRK